MASVGAGSSAAHGEPTRLRSWFDRLTTSGERQKANAVAARGHQECGLEVSGGDDVGEAIGGAQDGGREVVQAALALECD